MQIKLFLSELIEKDIHISSNEGELSVKFPKNQVDAITLDKIKANKHELITYLESLKKNEFLIIPAISKAKAYPISDAQKRLLILSQFDEDSVVYNMSNSIFLKGGYNIDSFKKAVDSTIMRHEILRTVFKEYEGEIKQWILNKTNIDFEIDFKDFRGAENKEIEVRNFVQQDAHKTFDLEKGPLLRAALLQIDEDEYIFYYNMHHIISDGWSMDVLFKDVSVFYKAHQENKAPELDPLRIHYKDYSTWQLNQLKEEAYEKHKRFWLENLSGELPLLDLPSTKQRPNLKTNKGQTLSTYIDSETTQTLKKNVQENGGSLFIGALAVWNILMYRYTFQTDIIMGTPVAAREHADLENQIGFYVNTLALRTQIDPEANFNSFYNNLKRSTLKSFSHQMYPFDRLVEELNLKRDTSRSVVFDMLLTVQNKDVNQAKFEATKEDVNRIVDRGDIASKFDIEIILQELGNYLSLQVVFNPDVYEKEMIESLIRHYKQLLRALLQKPSEKISEIDYLSEKEKQELLFTFNHAEVNYHEDVITGMRDNESAKWQKQKTLVDLFEEQVSKTPNNIAVLYPKGIVTDQGNMEDEELTYQELNERANQFAHYLLGTHKIKGNDLVGVQLDRSEWMLIVILGVLKTGGAYVPIDPDYPLDRISFMVEDSQCKLVIDEKELNKFKDEVDQYNSVNPEKATDSDNLAYVIYTSGSTGKPKGVMIEHKSLASFFASCNGKFNIKQKV